MIGQKSGPQSDEGSGGQGGPEKRERRNPEQIIVKLREIDADLGAGRTIEAIARKHGVSTVMISRWRQVFGRCEGAGPRQVGSWRAMATSFASSLHGSRSTTDETT